MTLALAFNLCIYYVSIFWLGMIVFPNWQVTKKVINSYIPFAPLCVLYIYFLLTTTDPGSLTGAFNPQLSEYAKLFGREEGALVVTIHFLAMDLFIGRWIYLQGQTKKIWTIHSLILCLFFGPAGLLAHFITDSWFSGDDNSADKDPETEKPKSISESVDS